jgi:hypothetical protein
MRHLPIIRAGHIINHCKVDDDTFAKESVHTWHLQTRGKGGKPQVTRYVREHGRTKNVFLAREIMGIDSSSPKQVYPLDGDPFNMQRDNLGVAAERRRIQHRATVRKLGGTRRIPQMGIAPIVNMAGFIESALRLGQESPYDGN